MNNQKKLELKQQLKDLKLNVDYIESKLTGKILDFEKKIHDLQLWRIKTELALNLAHDIDEEIEKERTYSFGQAIDLLIQQKVSKIGCWHRDDIYVFIRNNELRVHTIDGLDCPWSPNNREIISSVWRVIE